MLSVLGEKTYWLTRKNILIYTTNVQNALLSIISYKNKSGLSHYVSVIIIPLMAKSYICCLQIVADNLTVYSNTVWSFQKYNKSNIYI